MSKIPPTIPDDTCSYIDEVKRLVEGMVTTEDEEWRIEKCELIKAYMEYIRKSNEHLRESGIYWHELAKKKK